MYADTRHRVDAGRDRRDGPPARRSRSAYNVEHGIEPTTIVKGIHDLNERLRAVAESTVVYVVRARRRRVLDDADRAKVEALVARMEAEMRAAAKQLEFERAAALRDEIQQIRLRVLEQDAVGRSSAARRRSRRRGTGAEAARGDGARWRRTGGRRARRPAPRTALAAGGRRAAIAAGPSMEVTSVTVLPADEEPARTLDGEPGDRRRTPIADWLPGHPRRARGRRRLAGPLAGPADLGPDRHAEHPQADGPATGPAGGRR